MATRKATKKTKTAAAKSRAKATSTKKAAAKVTASKPAKSGKFSMLQKLLLASVVDYILVIAAVVLFMAPTYFDITIPYTTSDPLNADAGLVAASRHFYTVDLRWMLVALAAVSAVFALLYLTRLKDFYRKRVASRQLWTRWIETAIAAGLMLQTVALLSGWTDLVQQKFVFFLAAVLALLGYWYVQKADQLTKVAIWVTKLAFVALIGFTAVSTYIYGMATVDWYVYVLYGGVVVAFAWYGKLFNNTKLSGESLEVRLLASNVITRVGFAAVIILGLLK